MNQFSISCAGFCTCCQSVHSLPMGRAETVAQELIEKLEREKRLDFHVPPQKANHRLSTDYLFGHARGKMFGTMVCRQPDGALVTLKSFSGQYNGRWNIEGWAPPLFDLEQWHRTNDGPEKEIKAMGREIELRGRASAQGKALAQRRKERSKKLMRALHRLYRLHNFRGQCRPLSEVCTGRDGIPNGTADCCGPKLLDFAARNNLRPLGLAEFYYGRSNKLGMTGK